MSWESPNPNSGKQCLKTWFRFHAVFCLPFSLRFAHLPWDSRFPATTQSHKGIPSIARSPIIRIGVRLRNSNGTKISLSSWWTVSGTAWFRSMALRSSNFLKNAKPRIGMQRNESKRIWFSFCVWWITTSMTVCQWNYSPRAAKSSS